MNSKVGNKNNKELQGQLEKLRLFNFERNNYEILETNFRYRRLGEIDIISRKRIIFVLLRSRQEALLDTAIQGRL